MARWASGGLHYEAYPAPENFHFAVVKLLTLFTSDHALALNLTYYNRIFPFIGFFSLIVGCVVAGYSVYEISDAATAFSFTTRVLLWFSSWVCWTKPDAISFFVPEYEQTKRGSM